jgi:solute:Na+ symporter, SSS family
MQRALAVKRTISAPAVPLSMAVAKMIFAFLVVIPGAAAPLVLGSQLGTHWNGTLPALMLHYFKPSWRIIGILGLTASLTSAFANNISGFSAASMQGVYQSWIRPHAPESHFLRLGRFTNAGAILLAIGISYETVQFGSLMEFIQMIFSVFNAPLFALVLLAALGSKRAPGGGVAGAVAGVVCAGLHQALIAVGTLHYGSRMGANFYAAIASFCVTAVVATVCGHFRRENASYATSEEEPAQGSRLFVVPHKRRTVIWSLAVLCACILLNALLW